MRVLQLPAGLARLEVQQKASQNPKPNTLNPKNLASRLLQVKFNDQRPKHIYYIGVMGPAYGRHGFFY